MKDIIKSVQERQLYLIKKIHNVCFENNIKYTLLGGTLLGAVRHKGFIPWDDDLDIGLPRTDYEKLLKVLKEKPIEGCFLQTYETDKHYIQPYAKLRLNGTRYIERYWKNINMHQGIFVDIFPLDKIKRPGSKSTEFRRLLSKEITFSIWRKEGCIIKRKGLKKLETIASCLISLLPKKILIKSQYLLVFRENNNWDYYASMFSSNYSTYKVYFNKSDFDNLILIKYEDTELFVPSNYDEVLRRMFKNYRQFPPVNKRNSGHDVLKIEI